MQWDAMGNARPSPPAATNAQRQAEFRRRNPDYYRLLQRRRRAAIKARREAARVAAAQAATVVRREPLLLSAPVEPIEISGMNVIPSREEFDAMHAEAVAVAVSVPVR